MNRLIVGDSLEVLKRVKSSIFDCIITDPPYALISGGYRENRSGGFMNSKWDAALPSVEMWRECLRVLRPGSFAFVMSSPRQDLLYRMIQRLEEAGFMINFSSLAWAYSSGGPKGLNLGKATGDPKLEGWFAGLQTKPSSEIIIVAMKPIKEKSFKAQALKNLKGCTNINACRIPSDNMPKVYSSATPSQSGRYNWNREGYTKKGEPQSADPRGRFPANILFSSNFGGDFNEYFSLDAWWKKSGALDEIRETYPFLFVSKPNKKETNCGLPKGRKNKHLTVKPLKLMSYLIMLATRENDLILDPYVGSGTTCIAAKALKRRSIGIDIDRDNIEIAKKRLEAFEEGESL